MYRFGLPFGVTVVSEVIQDACAVVDVLRASAPVVVQAVRNNAPKALQAARNGAKMLYTVVSPDKLSMLRFDYAYFQVAAMAQILNACASHTHFPVQFSAENERYYILIDDLADLLLTSQEVFQGVGCDVCFIDVPFKDNHQYNPDADFELIPYDATNVKAL